MHVDFHKYRIPVAVVIVAVSALTAGAFYFFNRITPTDAATQYAYRWRNDNGSETTATFATSEGSPITVRPGDVDRLRMGATNSGSETEFAELDTVTFGAGEDSSFTAVSDPDAGFLYVGLQTAPGKIVKIRASDMTEIATITLPSGQDFIASSVIDTAAGFAYFSTSTTIGHIIKVRLSDFTIEENLTLPPGNESPGGMVIDEADNMLIFGESQSGSGKIGKVDLSTFDFVSSFSLAGDEYTTYRPKIDPATHIAYFPGLHNVAPNEGVVVRVDLDSFTELSALELDPGDYAPQSLAIDLDAGFLYVPSYTAPGKLIKIDLDSFTITDNLALPDFPIYLEADVANRALYVSDFSGSAEVTKVDLDAFSVIGQLPLSINNSGGGFTSDFEHGVLFATSYASPAEAAKISVAPRASFRLEYGEKATSCSAITDWKTVTGGNLGMELGKVDTFDLMTQNSEGNSEAGTVFDGRYLYFVPYFGANAGNEHSGMIARYDTRASFVSGSSWTFFDATAVDPDAEGFISAVFDDRYVYFTPSFTDNGYSGKVLRFDTTAAFTSSASYAVFDATTVDPEAGGFDNAVFDDRYVYYMKVINQAGSARIGLLVRYDTTADFTDSGSWETFDLTTIDASAKGYNAGIFDGRYIYYVPADTTFGGVGKFARFDTTGSFTSAGSYAFFDPTTISSTLKGYQGGTFDGRYAYFSPFEAGGTAADGQELRYDTQGSFTSSGSWETFDMKTISANSTARGGGAFDGRFVYVAPAITGLGAQDTTLMRYDTTQPFSDASSWSSFDFASDPDINGGKVGSVVDGYLYFAPFGSTVFSDGHAFRLLAREAFEMTDSTNLTDADPTTNVAGGLTDGNTSFKAGEVKDLNAETGSISLGERQFTELEYSLETTAFAPSGTDFCFRLTDAGDESALTFDSYGEASIRSTGGGGGGVTTTPAITVTSPNGGEVIPPGPSFPITWTTAGRADLVNISYSVDAGIRWIAVATNTLNTGNYFWNVPDVATSQALVRVEATDGVTVFASDVSDATFTITGTQSPPPPPIGLQQPVPAGTMVASPFSGLPEAVDEVHVGDYVRSPHFRGIYYVTDRFDRRPFAYAALFFTYESDLFKVREVSDATLATLPEGNSMPPKAGTVLLRFDGEPGIYGVFPGPLFAVDPLLRRIDSEFLAGELYGLFWKSYILSLDNLFFGDYTLAAPLINSQAVPTDGLITSATLHAKVAQYMSALMKAGYDSHGALPKRPPAR